MILRTSTTSIHWTNPWEYRSKWEYSFKAWEPNITQHNINMSGGAGHDLEFSTSVDGSIQQNVPLPPQTNNVLSGMIDSAAASSPTSPSPSSSYTPGSSTLPSVLQFSKSSHPTACLFHILFKGLAFTFYILGSKMMEDIMVTVLCILLLAADFWVVKNITGRLLVGLRWWSK